MRRVVVQQDSNDGFSRIVRVEILEKTNELAAAMPALDAGSDVPVMQIEGSQDRDRPIRRYSWSRAVVGYLPATGGRSGAVVARA